MSGKLFGDQFIVLASQLKNRDERDIEKVSSLAGAIASYTIPYAGLALQVVSLFSEEEVSGEEVVPRSYYDTTDLELNRYLLGRYPWQGKETIEVFYTDRLEREKIEAVSLEPENITIGGKTFECQVVALKGKQVDSTRWLALRADKHPLLVKEQLVEEGITFTFSLETE